MFAGSTFLEPSYLLNSENAFEVTEEINEYIELQLEVAKTFMDYIGNDSNFNIEHLTSNILDMVHLESDISRVSISSI